MQRKMMDIANSAPAINFDEADVKDALLLSRISSICRADKTNSGQICGQDAGQQYVFIQTPTCERTAMLSNDVIFNMDDALSEINEKEQILDAKINMQVILQLMDQKGIATREEVREMRGKVANSQKYKTAREYLENAKRRTGQYKADPQAHLGDLFNAKLDELRKKPG